jgi:hypothetical protein
LIAKESGFKQRSSKILPKSFIETVFFSNSNNSPSLSEYSIDLEHSSNTCVSKQALDKRFNERTKEMLYMILQQVMSKQVACKHSLVENKLKFTDIRIMDSSEFKLSKNLAATFPGYGGVGREASAQIQFEYQLFDSKITEFTIGSAIDSDSKAGMKNIDSIPADTLLLRDLGYFSPKIFNELLSKNLYFISRAKSHWNFYIRKDEKLVRFTTAEIINKSFSLAHILQKVLTTHDNPEVWATVYRTC